MIYIMTALHHEAAPIIKYYKMHKDMSVSKTQIFTCDNVILTISGVGAINAAASAAYLLAARPPGDGDIFVNIGICGAVGRKVGEVVICNKLSDITTGRDYYPEMLYNHPFSEGHLTSFPYVVSEISPEKIDLADMEGVFFYQSAVKYMPTQSIMVIKTVSDNMSPKGVTPDIIRSLICDTINKAEPWLSKIDGRTGIIMNVLTDEEEKLINKVCERLKFTEYMRKHVLNKVKIRNDSVMDIFIRYENVSANEKKEAKLYYEEIIKNL